MNGSCDDAAVAGAVYGRAAGWLVEGDGVMAAAFTCDAAPVVGVVDGGAVTGVWVVPAGGGTVSFGELGSDQVVVVVDGIVPHVDEGGLDPHVVVVVHPQ